MLIGGVINIFTLTEKGLKEEEWKLPDECDNLLLWIIFNYPFISTTQKMNLQRRKWRTKERSEEKRRIEKAALLVIRNCENAKLEKPLEKPALLRVYILRSFILATLTPSFDS